MASSYYLARVLSEGPLTLPQLSAVYNIGAGFGGGSSFNQLAAGAKIQVVAQAMYGYGYSRPYMDLYQEPRVACGLEDYEALLEEFQFLEHPDFSTDVSVLSYYASEFNHQLKLDLFCLVNLVSDENSDIRTHASSKGSLLAGLQTLPMVAQK